MKYIRYETSNNDEYVGILDGDIIYRLDYPSVIDAIRDENTIKSNYKSNIKDVLSDIKILPPVCASKVVCVGLNYKDHAEELDMELPKEPLLFIKPSTSIIADGQIINYPESTNKLDYEGELGIVILNKTSKSYNENSIAGYTIINDVTARDLQENDGQWTRSKGFNTFCPCGPVVSTDINPLNLKISVKVNNETKQDSNTKNMIFSPSDLVEYISNIMTLNPGDLIATGTPPGVGQLEDDDIVEVSIENIGILRNIVKK